MANAANFQETLAVSLEASQLGDIFGGLLAWLHVRVEEDGFFIFWFFNFL
jgi:hypothetical protein